LAKECAKIDPEFEGNMAEDGFLLEIEKWARILRRYLGTVKYFA